MLVESNTLAQHHRRCDALFAAARDAAAAGEPLALMARVAELREALLSHFRFEEEHVFPLYEQASGLEGDTEWLCAQHDDMRGSLWLLGSLSAEAEPQRYRAELAELQSEFDAHAAEEERRMYPLFEPLLRK
jgi:iron-sulfur cluster repair protein YtfE (RIC family)